MIADALLSCGFQSELLATNLSSDLAARPCWRPFDAGAALAFPLPPPRPLALLDSRFALAAGLTSAISSSSVIALAVVSELIAGAISMGLGGYLSGRVEADTHDAEREREEWEVVHKKEEEEEEVVHELCKFGLTREQCEPVLEHFRKNPTQWGTFVRCRRWGGRGGVRAGVVQHVRGLGECLGLVWALAGAFLALWAAAYC